MTFAVTEPSRVGRLLRRHKAKWRFKKGQILFFFQKSQKGPNFINVLTRYQSDLVQLISSILNLSSKVFNFINNETVLS